MHSDEPFAATQMDGLPPTIHIDEALPSTQTNELLLYTLTSSSLQLRWTGSHLQLLLTKLFPQLRWTSSHYTLLRALRCNSDGRAPTTTLIDEALPSTQMDELPLFKPTSPSLQPRWTGSHLQLFLTKLFTQLRWTSSYYSN